MVAVRHMYLDFSMTAIPNEPLKPGT